MREKKTAKKVKEKKKKAVKKVEKEKKKKSEKLEKPKLRKKILRISAEKEVQKKTKPVLKKPSGLKNYEIILFPLITEKAVGMIETQNKLSFIVNKKATKLDVRIAVEEMFNVEVDSVKILNDLKGRKKAIVKVNEKFKADDIATKLGVI